MDVLWLAFAGVWERPALTRSTSFNVASLFDEDLNKAIHKPTPCSIPLRAYIAIVRFVPKYFVKHESRW
jgi:hypothetical protein